MKCYLYIIHSKSSNRFYTGISKNVERRLSEHNSGAVKPTKAYRPWHLIHIESFSSVKEARDMEIYYKSGVGREFRNKYLEK